MGASDTPSAHLSTSSKVVGYTTTTTRVSATSSSITASENALTEEKARTGLIAWLNDNFCQIYAPIQSILEKTIVIVDTRTGDEVIEQCAIDRYDSDPDFRKFVVERAKKYREMAKGAGEPVSKYARRMANTLRGVNIDDWGYHDWKREARKEGKIETPAPKTDILYIPEE